VTGLRTTALALALVPALLVTGCSGDGGESDPAPTTPVPVSTTATPTGATPSATSASAGPSGSASATSTPTPRPSRVPPPVSRPIDSIPQGSGDTVVLRGDGLALASGTSIRLVPFGSSVSTITTALAATLGKGKTSAQPECGQGPRTQVDYNGFTVLLDGAKFVGWTESGSAERDLATADEIALQVTLAEVRQAFPKAKVSNGSLGPEFFVAGGVSGLLDGTAPQSRVTLLYGGETCFFR
jgi:hypothetical protein